MNLEIVLSVCGGIILYKTLRSIYRGLVKSIFKDELKEYLKQK
jgi:hypothetical protein